MSDLEERTIEPTPRRREEARARGEVARSPELTAAAAILAGVGALWLCGPVLSDRIAGMTRNSLSSLHEASEAGLAQQLPVLVLALSEPLLPVLALTVLAALVCGLIQTGFVFTWQPVAPRLDRLRPQFGRIFSAGRSAASILKAAALVGVLAAAVWRRRDVLSGGARLEDAFTGLLFDVAGWGALALLALGGADYWLQRRRHERSLRMTPAEAREEARRHEGNSEIRRHRRQEQRRLASAPVGLDRVADAAVVVAGPDGAAVAVEFDPDRAEAPRVVAKGTGVMGRRIVELAHDHQVPVVESAGAARLFRRCEVGRAVPAGDHGAVAEALAFVMAGRERVI